MRQLGKDEKVAFVFCDVCEEYFTGFYGDPCPNCDLEGRPSALEDNETRTRDGTRGVFGESNYLKSSLVIPSSWKSYA